MKTFRRVNKALLSQAEIRGITMLLFRFADLFFTHIIQLSESISVGVFSFFSSFLTASKNQTMTHPHFREILMDLKLKFFLSNTRPTNSYHRGFHS